MVKMVIGEVQTQTDQIKAFGQSYSQALEAVSSATQGIQLAVGMSGEGMDAIKGYISSVYPTICKAAILHSEATVKANENYLKGYISQCGSEDLDSEELKAQIVEVDCLIQSYQTSKDSYEEAKRNLTDDEDKLVGMIFQAVISSMEAGITRNQAIKTKLEEKLEKFLTFDKQSQSYFTGLDDTGNLLATGMEDLGANANGSVGVGSWNGKGFTLKERPWIKGVNQKWEERLEVRDKELFDNCKIIHVVDKERGVDMYMFEKNGRRFQLNEKDLSGDLQDLIKKYGLDVLELSPTEMAKRVNDFQKNGRDYFTGKKVMPGFGALAHGQDVMGNVQESGLWDAMWALGLTGAAVRNAQIYGKKASGAGGLGSGNVGDFSNLQGTSIDDILSRIPKDANKRVLTPQPGKVTEGFEYTWKASDGTKMTVRVHGPDASAPSGSNAANGWIARVQKGKKYLDPVSGEFQPSGISRPNSEFYNEGIINSTHIPIQPPKK